MSSKDADEILEKTTCPKCQGSGHTLTRYRDGHAHCFNHGCGYFERADGEKPTNVVGFTRAPSRLLNPDWSDPKNKEGLPSRKLQPETCRKLGIFRHGYKGGWAQVYPFYDMDGEEVMQKLKLEGKVFERLWDDPDAEKSRKATELMLFGRHYFGDKHDRQVIITEGEPDMAAVCQAINWKTTVVSLTAGADGAVANIKANYLWVDRFDDIVLWFDKDEAGFKASQEVAALFKVGKVRIAKTTGFMQDGKTPCKDANDMLMAGDPGGIQSVIYAATTWRPKGIINAKANPSDVLAPKERVAAWSYPKCMPKLQEMSGGMREGDVIYHVAGTGVGKSTNIREIIWGLVEQDCKVGVMSFEDTVRDIKQGIMSVPASERLSLIPEPDPDDKKAVAAYDKKMLHWHEVAFGSGHIELFDPETAEWTLDAILGYQRFMAKALDCKVVIIEPISFVASTIDIKADERRVLDMCASEFAKNSKELGITTLISHHLKRVGQGTPHEEGAPTSLNELRSSGGLANFATGVIGWERNNQAEGDGWRVTQARVLKPFRRTGKSGLADLLYYQDNGRFLCPSPIPFPPIGKPKDGEEGERRGFEPVSMDY